MKRKDRREKEIFCPSFQACSILCSPFPLLQHPFTLIFLHFPSPSALTHTLTGGFDCKVRCSVRGQKETRMAQRRRTPSEFGYVNLFVSSFFLSSSASSAPLFLLVTAFSLFQLHFVLPLCHCIVMCSRPSQFSDLWRRV